MLKLSDALFARMKRALTEAFLMRQRANRINERIIKLEQEREALYKEATQIEFKLRDELDTHYVQRELDQHVGS